MAKETSAMFVEGMAFNAYGMSCYYKGLFDEAKNSLLKGLDFCERTGHVVWGSLGALSLGDIYFDLGKYEEAKSCYKRGLSILEPGKILPSLMKLLEVAVVRVKALERERDVDLSELIQYYNANKFKVFQAWMARYIVEILLNIGEGQISDAEDWIKKAIMRWFLGSSYALYAELFKRKGDQSRAKENMKKAIKIFKECGADGWVKRFEKELVEL
jgi:tetratricopeptide (TPR) repeat protein